MEAYGTRARRIRHQKSGHAGASKPKEQARPTAKLKSKKSVRGNVARWQIYQRYELRLVRQKIRSATEDSDIYRRSLLSDARQTHKNMLPGANHGEGVKRFEPGQRKEADC